MSRNSVGESVLGAGSSYGKFRQPKRSSLEVNSISSRKQGVSELSADTDHEQLRSQKQICHETDEIFTRRRAKLHSDSGDEDTRLSKRTRSDYENIGSISGCKSGQLKSLKTQTSGRKAADFNEPPKYSYVALIATVLEECTKKKLTLSEIYKAIENKWPYFKNSSANWKNSIRHNLSLNECFIKIPKLGSGEKKGNYWAISSDYKFCDMFQGDNYQRRKRKRTNCYNKSLAYNPFHQSFAPRYGNGRNTTGLTPSMYGPVYIPYKHSSTNLAADLLNSGHTHTASYSLGAEEYCSSVLSASVGGGTASHYPTYSPTAHLLKTAHLHEYTNQLPHSYSTTEFTAPQNSSFETLVHPSITAKFHYPSAVSEYDQDPQYHLNSATYQSMGVYNSPYSVDTYTTPTWSLSSETSNNLRDQLDNSTTACTSSKDECKISPYKDEYKMPIYKDDEYKVPLYKDEYKMPLYKDEYKMPPYEDECKLATYKDDYKTSYAAWDMSISDSKHTRVGGEFISGLLAADQSANVQIRAEQLLGYPYYPHNEVGINTQSIRHFTHI